MIEQRIISYLNANMSYPVYGELPDDGKDGRFAVIMLKLLTCKNFISKATVTAYCYGVSEDDACNYANDVKNTMLAMNTLGDISSVKLVDLSRDNDLHEKKYRYTVTMNFWFYED